MHFNVGPDIVLIYKQRNVASNFYTIKHATGNAFGINNTTTNAATAAHNVTLTNHNEIDIRPINSDGAVRLVLMRVSYNTGVFGFEELYLTAELNLTITLIMCPTADSV